MNDQKTQMTVSVQDKLIDQLTAEQSALPKDFNKTRFVQNALSVVLNNEQLRTFPDKDQVMAGLIKGAYLGLDFMSNECYLIPYNKTLRFQMSYIGLKKFVRKYAIREIQDIYAKLVREGDEFTEKIVNGQPTIDFKPIPFSNKPYVGTFAVVLYKDGGMEYEVMTKDEVNEIRDKHSKASDKGAWKDSWGEMAKKTCIRRLVKAIPVSFESVEAHNVWDESGEFEFGKPKPSEIVADPFAKEEENVVDVEATEITEPEQIELPDFLKGDE